MLRVSCARVLLTHCCNSRAGNNCSLPCPCYVGPDGLATANGRCSVSSDQTTVRTGAACFDSSALMPFHSTGLVPLLPRLDRHRLFSEVSKLSKRHERRRWSVRARG